MDLRRFDAGARRPFPLATPGAAVDPDRPPGSITIHSTAPPEEGPLRIEARIERMGRSLTCFSRALGYEGLEEDGEVWSRGGQLLAQSRQLAVVG
jgi:hypothetical protein